MFRTYGPQAHENHKLPHCQGKKIGHRYLNLRPSMSMDGCDAGLKHTPSSDYDYDVEDTISAATTSGLGLSRVL